VECSKGHSFASAKIYSYPLHLKAFPAFVPKAKKIFCKGRSSDLLCPEENSGLQTSLPIEKSSTVDSGLNSEVTAAGTVSDFHGIPF